MKVGAHLVVRELLHHEIIGNPLVIPHAYAPIQRIRDFFQGFGEYIETSQDIHRLLVKYLDEERAAFDGAYDIPLRILAADESLQRELFC